MKPFQFNGARYECKGIVAATSISAIAVFGVLALSLLGSRSDRGAELLRQEHEAVAQGIAESALDLAESRLFMGYASDGGIGFGEHLDRLGIESGSGGLDFQDQLGLPQDPGGGFALGGGVVTELRVLRWDTDGRSKIRMEVLATAGEGALEQRSQRTYDGAGRSKEE